ncbi:HTTM domain-containing protein [Candidatus Laterigemmans baculatus]|uniref:HTTM domain-containing protein n=1 Tax=Candidatus Laterigemmans baculatus TaxID=2770505 RepID=UPI0013DCF20A|nr:HTTM domain-containing protein [Candidatus Laterigemmans baculatus]
MNAVAQWFRDSIASWDRFWFTPRLPHTLAVIRIATGAMLLYTHLVLASDLLSFLGPEAWIDNATARSLHDGTFGPDDAGWSYLWSIDSAAGLWLHQLLAILVSACLMLGLATRLTAPLAWFIQLMIVHRLTGALFGLDQLTTMLAMYLMLAPCGAVYSLDAVIRRRMLKRRGTLSPRLGWWFPEPRPTVAVCVATRLGQLHLCVIYLFGGLWKARGEMWWDGTALWFSAANYEYQSLDLTWVAHYPVLFAAATHLTIFWETFYCALVWPRLTRPFVLATAVAIHGGIALFLGMITFGLIMIVANGMFLEPEWTRRLLRRRGGGSEEASPEERRVAHSPRG